ncbi:MAG TPA: CD225/dispanin family protein [Rhodanobacteraceae bacterium]|nr:CD225/dispanin family protein [Rhodanobacteraceae bacterium]
MAYCRNCGQPNADDAAFCSACGTAIRQPTAPPSGQPAAPATPAAALPVAGTPDYVPNYLVPSILLMLFCCLPGGIVALVYASSVNGRLAQGDRAGAIAASKSARLWCMISVGVGVAIAVIWLVAWLVPLIMDSMVSPY